MNFKKLLIVPALIAIVPTFSAMAAGSGEGVVHFKGEVIDAPCGISPGTVDQTIDFGQISMAHLASGGSSDLQAFDIELTNCVITAASTVDITFTGTTNTAGDVKELGTAGNTGTVVKISQSGDELSFDGSAAAGTTALAAGTNTLTFNSWVTQGTGLTAKEGAFDAVVNFRMTYL